MKRVAYIVIAANLVIFIVAQYGNRDLQRGDFKMFYTAALALRSGHRADLYDSALHARLQQGILPDLPRTEIKVYTHPPFELLAYLPLSFCNYGTACYLWLAISLALALFASRTLGSYAALFGSFPFLIAMLEQQDSMLILLVTTGCWVALRKERWTLAGVMLGIGLIRFPIFIPLTLIIAFWKPITLKGFAFSSCIVSLISLALVGPSGIASYVDYLLRMGRESSAQISALYQIDPRTMPTIRGLCFIAGFPHLYVPFALFILLAAWKFMRSTRRSQDKYAFAICAALLVSPHSLMHDFTMLALPLVLFSSPITLSLMPFYLAPLDFLLYPHAQAGLAVPLLATVALAFQYTDKQCSTTFSAETPGAHVRTLNRPDSDIARRQMCRARSLRRSPRLRDAYDEIPIYCLNSS